jgi:hypothetical protein
VRRFQPAHRRRPRLSLERLEERALPSNYTAASVPELIAAINAANAAGGSNTITLTATTTAPYVLTAVDNTTDGANGLPVISKNDTLTIVGNGDTIERSTASGTRDFRLMDVASGGSLTLENLTLQNGSAFGSGTAAEGGALYNKGTLVLSGVTVQGNYAEGSAGPSGARNGHNGQDAAGGGIWSNGSLTLENGTTVQSNEALGGTGGHAGSSLGDGGNGANGLGGGVYVAGGTVTLTGATLSGNTAKGGFGGVAYGSFGAGGHGGNGGNGLGGGLYVAGGTVTLTGATLSGNTAQGGFGGPGQPSGTSGDGFGGGLYLAGGKDYLDAFTVNNTINNTATYYPNIYGSYILQ